MFIFGKIIGGLFGFFLAGPFGALIGIAVGHYFDKGLRNNWHIEAAVFPKERRHIQQIFFTSTFLVMGHLAKCDGQISEDEIRAAQTIMDRMQLSAEQRQTARNLFNEGKRAGFAIDPVLRQLYEKCHGHRQLLQLFIHIQLQAAYADGRLTDSEQRLLHHICTQLGFSHVDYAPFETFYHGSSYKRPYQEQNYQTHEPPQSRQSSLQAAYVLLDIAPNATDAEVKRAYRRQMSQNHPDKLVSKGLPAEMMKLATEKTQEIQEAYEVIKKARGL